MNRIFLNFLAGCLLFAVACKKDDVENVFGQKPEERISDTLTFIRNELVNAPNGWKGGFSTGAKGGFGFYFNFKDDQTVDMLSDYSTSSGNELKSSTYRVSPLFTPTLIFDTYNYITIMQDPAPDAGGAAGSGFKSDIEFLYERHNADTLFFTGKKYRQPFTLIRLSKEEQESYLNGGLNKFNTDFTNLLNNNYGFTYFDNAGGGKISLEIDYIGKMANFVYVNSSGGIDSVYQTSYYTTSSSYNLVKPVKIVDKQIRSFVIKGNVIEGESTDNTTTTLKSQTSPALYSVSDAFGNSKPFKKMVSRGKVNGVDANVAIFDRVTELFKASGRTINNMYFTMTNSSSAIFYINYTSGTSTFIASATYTYRREADRIYLKRTGIDGGNNWSTRATQVKPVDDLFGDGSKELEFKFDWVFSSDSNVKLPVAAIRSVANPTNMLYGKLQIQ
ncbi:DUF4302 domain-containing protein [Sphingobacterium thalpophilum]|uniref:DUF4302 domain-containing protein n=1 Tax=Sphingobacterium thalpophilum TaxID=259 RepID=UPI003C720CFF